MTKAKWTDVLATVMVVAGVVFLLASCAQLDKFFTPDPETGRAPVDDVKDVVQDVGGTALGGPWGEIASGIIALIGAGYLIVRKIQRARAGASA